MSGFRIAEVPPPAERFKKMEKFGSEIQLDHSTPIRRYYKSGAEIFRQANNYFDDESLERAYVLYHRYLSLFIEKVDKHPEFRSVPLEDKVKVKANLLLVLKRCEEIKAKLKVTFQREYSAYQEQLELQRREDEELARRLEQQRLDEEDQRLRQETDDFRRAKELSMADARDAEFAIWRECQMNEAKALEDLKNRHDTAAGSQVNQPSAPPPPYEDVQLPTYDRSIKPSHQGGYTAVPVVPDRSTKPDLSADLGYLGGNLSGGLRNLVVPETLMPSFLSIAEPNTTINVETCGFLAGRIAKDQLVITHLVVPRQTGTADSCTVQGEEDFYGYLDDNNLITLGWIHTHPSQTAFLSSVDLHTHMPYQQLLPEAVAIVCAPKFNETGFFVLTPNYGLDYIKNCRASGFHPHPKEPPLFEEGPHVTVSSEANVKVVDLR